MIKRSRGTPIVAQVATLALLCVIAAQSVGVGIVLLAPPPAPPTIGVDDVARVAEGGKNDNLTVAYAAEPSIDPTPDRPGLATSLIANSLSELLHKSRDDVRIAQLDVPVVTAAPADSRPPIVVIPPHSGGKEPVPAVAPSMNDLIRGPFMKLKPFVTAIRQNDGRWMIIRPNESWVSPWQTRILLGFLMTIVLLAPIVWLSSRLLTRSISIFAKAADSFGQDLSVPPLAEGEGPSEVRTAVRSLNRMQERLRRHLDERTAMVAAMAHDLRTPLTSMRFRAESLPDEMRDRMIEDIERLNKMAGQVLAFVRGEQAREQRERIDLSELAIACAQEIADTGANVSWSVAPGLEVMGEPINLRRSLTNLVDNAVKFGGCAEVTLAREGTQIVFRVEDEGPGVPENKLEQIFEPFQRVETSRNRLTGGVGLGLALVRTVVRAHGGEISLKNRDARGLTAWITLPAA